MMYYHLTHSDDFLRYRILLRRNKKTEDKIPPHFQWSEKLKLKYGTQWRIINKPPHYIQTAIY